jgi:hypothetical protein
MYNAILYLILEMDDIDWSCCIICQSQNDEDLRSPLETTPCRNPNLFKEFCSRVEEFRSLGDLPINKNHLPHHTMLNEKKAKWHSGCRRIFDQTYLERAKESKKPKQQKVKAEKTIRQSGRTKESFKELLKSNCAFCMNKCDAELHLMTTFGMDDLTKKNKLKS